KVMHEFRRRGDRIEFASTIDGEVQTAVVEYAFGAPDRYVSLVGRTEQGASAILRLSHYQADGAAGWVKTTGHSADAGGGSDFLGKRLEERGGLQKCLFCHATNPKAVLDQSAPEAADRAIGCERCHGPGQNHVQAVAGAFSDRAIINPARASAEGRL